MNYREYCISENDTVKGAMKKLDSIDKKILFITTNNKVIASLTDGDIRRYLLSGGSLLDEVIKAGNVNPSIVRDRFEAINLFHQKNFIAIPIVSEEGYIEEIYFDNENGLDQIANLNVPVVINAGGKGTRLEPYTKILPKPLIPVGDLPIIDHIINQFKRFGCLELHIIVNYKKELVKAYFAESDQKRNISFYEETQPLGTGGGLCFLKNKIKETFFFTNCDNLLLSNYKSMMKYHKENDNAVTMICAYKNYTIPYGVIEMGRNGSILSMTEKPEMSFLANTGIYIVEPYVLNEIEDDVEIGFPSVIDKIRAKGMKVSVYPISENEWLDMGQISELDNMRKRLYGE